MQVFYVVPGARAWKTRVKCCGDAALPVLHASQSLTITPPRRRVLLSGTPMQNDLEEFFSMVDFTNPGLHSGVCRIALLSRASCVRGALSRKIFGRYGHCVQDFV